MFSDKYKLRYATQEEIEGIAPTSDLTAQSVVIVGEPEEGGDKQFAVLRQVLEVDPLIPGEDTKALRPFVWAFEQHLRLSGHREYYFNVQTTEETWIKRIEDKEGSVQRMSPAPEYRYKRTL